MSFLSTSAGRLLPLAVVLAALLIAYGLYATRPEARLQAPEEKVWPVDVVTVRHGDAQPTITAYGQVVTARAAELRAMVAGRVIELNQGFGEGAVVSAGTPLVRIDPFTYEQAITERSAALDEIRNRILELERDIAGDRALIGLIEEQVELFRRDLKRAQDLAGRKQISDKALDDARLALNGALQTQSERTNSVRVKQARLGQLAANERSAQAALNRAERDLEDTEILAPFDGFVDSIEIGVGKRVAVGESVGRLLDARRLEARFELSDSDYARLLDAGAEMGRDSLEAIIGRKVYVSWRLGDGELKFEGAIARVGARVDSQRAGITVFAALDTADNTALRPGAFVALEVPGVRYENVVTLPGTALGESGTVYVIADERLEARTVTPLRKSSSDYLVQGELADGEQVVARQFDKIGPGLKVSVQ